jgi:hypothetical protein
MRHSKTPNKIGAANAGWRSQFRFRGFRLWPGVADLGRWANEHCMKLAPLVLAVALLSGCILPYPHTTERSAEVRGRVLDARTDASVQGAKVFLSEHPTVSCTSDITGHFRLRATHNFHVAVAGPEGADLPRGEDWGLAVTVSHKNYVTYVQHGLDDHRLTDKGDILLEPKR